MTKALWNNVLIAESNDCKTVEGNKYFPPGSLVSQHFKPSETHSYCSWKGEASYYDVEVDGKINKDAAWFYSEPKTAAAEIAGHIAFWHGVVIVD